MTRALARLALLLVLLLPMACAAQPLGREQLAPRLAQLAERANGGRAAIRGEPLHAPRAVAAFYAARNDAPAWKLPEDAVSMRKAIDGLAADGLNPDDYHRALLGRLLEERDRARTPELDADLEITLTDAVATAVDHLQHGRIVPRALNPAWNMDPRADAPPLEQAVAQVAAAGDPAAGLERARIDHFIYRGLVAELARLRAAQSRGGWPRVAVGARPLAPGARDPRVPAVRARLRATGELPADAAPPADSLVFDPRLVAAVKLFQARHRLDPKGAIDKTTAAEMSVPVGARIGQVRANLERARWVLPGLTGDFLLVNLPAFKVYLIRGNRNVWESRTVIGKDYMQTPSFRSDMKYVIFNPTWTLPRSIVAREIAGAKEGPEAAIAKQHLKVLDAQGHEVSPGSVDWGAAGGEGDFPYTLRQDPGPENALGRIKFMFPNRYDVYLHDTPSRGLFAAERRAFSHGCIRVQDAAGLAEQLLGPQGWDAGRIQDAIAAGETQQVDLAQPLPVVIVYWTVSVGASGEVRYGPDVYGMDAPLVRALEGGPVVPHQQAPTSASP